VILAHLGFHSGGWKGRRKCRRRCLAAPYIHGRPCFCHRVKAGKGGGLVAGETGVWVDWGRAEGLEEEEERVGRCWWYADGLLDGGAVRNDSGSSTLSRSRTGARTRRDRARGGEDGCPKEGVRVVARGHGSGHLARCMRDVRAQARGAWPVPALAACVGTT
jgi:hypothetical protein